MTMKALAAGPFVFVQTQKCTVNGAACARLEMRYGGQLVAERVLTAALNDAECVEAFSQDRADFERDARKKYAPDTVHLIDFETDKTVASIVTDSACGMSPGLPNDSSAFWLRSANRLQSRPVSLQVFAAIAAQHAAPARAWIAGLLPDDVLTQDAQDWRAPTAWELRHLVGAGSFTGVTGAQAAALCGVTPQNFRKYTARDDASTRQPISFAMWHLLLHRLGVQKMESAGAR